MNDTFETIRKQLKKYNAEDNDAPPKLVVADRNDFLNIQHKRKRNSQFIIAVKEFLEADKLLVEGMVEDLEKRSGTKPLTFLYNSKEAIDTVINDFQDYYNETFDNGIFQRIGSYEGHGEVQFYLVIVILENYYYET